MAVVVKAAIPPTTVEQSANSSHQPQLIKDFAYGSFKLENTGITALDKLEITPFNQKSIMQFKATGQTHWRLNINTPSIADTPNVNPLTTFGIETDAKDHTKIAAINLTTPDVHINCQHDCDTTYQDHIQKESDGKTYFTVLANGQVSGSATKLNNNNFAENAKITGQIKFEINPDWPVFDTKNRFKTLDAESSLSINDQKISPLLSAYNEDLNGQLYFELIFNLNQTKQKLSFSNLLANSNQQNFIYILNYTAPVEDYYLYGATWNQDFSFEKNYEKGYQRLHFISQDYTTAVGYHEAANLKLSGSLQERIPFGEIKTSNETFTVDTLSLYSINESKYFDFYNAALDTHLNVKCDVINQRINLAYQAPKKGVVNINIFEKWNCKTVNDNCAGITINEDAGTIKFDNVRLDDGRILNGELGNVGIPHYSTY